MPGDTPKAKCQWCPHPSHLGACNSRMGRTAYRCGCWHQTPATPSAPSLDATYAALSARVARLEAALRNVSRTASCHHEHEDAAVLLHALLVEIPELARAALEDKP